MTTFGDRLFELGGVPVQGGGVSLNGTWYYVDGANGNAANDGLSPSTALLTISAALAKCTSGKNDVVCVLASTSGINETAAITWDKNLTHLIGVGAPNHAAQRTRIVCNAADLSPFITISGYGCIFKNVYLWQGQNDVHSLILCSISGSRNYFENVHFAGGGHTAQAIDGGMCVQINGGSENLFKHCTFGVDTVAASTGFAALSFPATGGAARNVFEDCLFTLHAAGTTPAGVIFVELLGNSGIDRYQLFRRCTFVNLATSMTSAFVLAAGFDAANKRVLLQDCAMVGAGEWDSGNNGILFLNTGTITGGTNAGFFLVSAT